MREEAEIVSNKENERRWFGFRIPLAAAGNLFR